MYSNFKVSLLLVTNCILIQFFNPLSDNPTNCLSVFDHFVELGLKGLRKLKKGKKRVNGVGLIANK